MFTAVKFLKTKKNIVCYIGLMRHNGQVLKLDNETSLYFRGVCSETKKRNQFCKLIEIRVKTKYFRDDVS